MIISRSHGGGPIIIRGPAHSGLRFVAVSRVFGSGMVFLHCFDLATARTRC
jgi:hypothetical protein